jgi:branched-chain amino acid transport system ATP-binding protein
MLQVQALTGGYGRIQVLAGVSLEVHEGEIVSLMGSNGSGKSTVCRVLSGLLPAWSGTVELQGSDITNDAPHRIARHGLLHVPEGHQDFDAMSVEENLLVGGATLRDKRQVRTRLESVYEMFPRLSERREQRAGLLSGGERRMLAMGRGMMPSPRLLVLDEPSQGLAPAFVDEVADLIGAVRANGASVLLVEQNLRLAKAVSDRTYILDHGTCTPLGPEQAIESALESVYLGRAESTEHA